MKSRAAIWNVLHDGDICDVHGCIPGDVTIRVGISYLRHMFSDDGDDIIVTLHECSELSMHIWESDTVTEDFDEIVHTQAEILSTDSEDVPVRIITTLGTLNMSFESFSLQLDTGKVITYEDLCDASDMYWDRWEKDARAKKNLV